MRATAEEELLSPCATRGQDPLADVCVWRGQLKLDIYKNSGLITVHIVEGRYFTLNRERHNRKSCGTFVRVSKTDAKGRKSVVLLETAVHVGENPVFDEKVTVEASDGESRHRILISVWTAAAGDPQAELDGAGCTSFGLRGALSKRRTGWFHLLHERVGVHKHVRAMDMSSYRPARRASYLHSLWQQQQQLMVHIRRGSRGFGLCLGSDSSGSVQVSLVDPGGPAFAAGVRSGDLLVSINGEQVRGLSQDAVLRRIRACPLRVALCVQRSALPTHGSSPDLRGAGYEDVFGSGGEEAAEPRDARDDGWAEAARRQATQRIVELEQDFVWRSGGAELVDVDLERHLREIKDISQSHLNQILASADYSNVDLASQVVGIRNIGQIYRFRVQELCDVFRAYSDALQANYERFNIGRTTPGSHSRSRSMYRPLEHLNSLLKELRVILNNTRSTDPDYLPLSSVVEQFETCCQSVFPVHVSQERPGSVTTESSLPSDLSGSIDSELVRLQQRLQFAPSVETVNLCQPQRHLIFSSELFLVSPGAGSIRRVFALLLNDLMLVTERQPNEMLNLLQEPLLLRSCASANFSLIGSQFSISFVDPPRHILFRAPTYELKIVWKNLVMQRLEVCG